MKIVERKFLRTRWYWRLLGGTMDLCDKEFPEVFDISGSLNTCWLSLHTRPATNRLAVKILDDGIGGCDILIDDRDAGASDEEVLWDLTLDRVLQRYIGKTLYVECRYEE